MRFIEALVKQARLLGQKEVQFQDAVAGIETRQEDMRGDTQNKLLRWIAIQGVKIYNAWESVGAV